MSCEKCEDLCVRFAIHAPYQLRQAIRIAKQNLDDLTLSEIEESPFSMQASFSQVADGGPWDDVVGYRFRCTSCGEMFSLHAETYHGSGGYWEPENSSSVRKNL